MQRRLWRLLLNRPAPLGPLAPSVTALVLLVGLLTTNLLFARPSTAQAHPAAGQQRSAPVSIQIQAGMPRLEVFEVAGGVVYHAWSDDQGATWQPWAALDMTGINADGVTYIFTAEGKPAVVSDGAERLRVFVTSTTPHVLFQTTYDGTSWSIWNHVPGTEDSGVLVDFNCGFLSGCDPYFFDSSPAVASWGTGRLDLFIYARLHRYANDPPGPRALLHTWADQFAWSGAWEILEPDYMLGDPAAVSWGPGRVDVFARHEGTSSAWDKWFDNGAWVEGLDVLEGTVGSDLTAASWQPGVQTIFARDPNGHLEAKGFWGQWFGWGVVDDTVPIATTPAVTTWGLGTWDVFARKTGADRTLMHKRYYDNSWHDWVPLGGPLATSAPAAAVWVPHGITVPNVLFEDQAMANADITAVGLTVGTVTPDNSCTDVAGSVIMQDPIGGVRMRPGSVVNLWVSSGVDSRGKPCIIR